MTPDTLMKAYPFLDHLMAETLLKAHEAGTLMTYVEDMPDPNPGPAQSTLVADAITVTVENKNASPMEQEAACEANSPN